MPTLVEVLNAFEYGPSYLVRIHLPNFISNDFGYRWFLVEGVEAWTLSLDLRATAEIILVVRCLAVS